MDQLQESVKLNMPPATGALQGMLLIRTKSTERFQALHPSEQDQGSGVAGLWEMRTGKPGMSSALNQSQADKGTP